jgi:hypothetical protein
MKLTAPIVKTSFEIALFYSLLMFRNRLPRMYRYLRKPVESESHGP